jgi:hypothetical protein
MHSQSSGGITKWRTDGATLLGHPNIWNILVGRCRLLEVWSVFTGKECSVMPTNLIMSVVAAGDTSSFTSYYDSQ